MLYVNANYIINVNVIITVSVNLNVNVNINVSHLDEALYVKCDYKIKI